jgi:two-component system NtrC family sensor kinase
VSIDIKRLKQTNKELKEIVNNSWDGIAIMDKTSKLVYVNNAFSPIFGYKKEEFIGKTFESLIIDEYRFIFKDLLKENIINKYSSETEVICQRKDNQKVYILVTISLMANQKFFILNTKDITKQISDDEILDRYLISCQTDTNGMITQVSEAFCQLSGFSKDELIGQTHKIMKDETTPKETISNLWDTITQGNEWSGKIKNLTKDRQPFFIDIKIKPIYNKYGDITGYTSLMFNITNELYLATAKKTLEDEIAIAEDEIKQKDDILVQQSKLAIMGETLQMVSHEWRQPLNIISIQAQKLELAYSLGMPPQEDEVVSTLEGIKAKAEELSTVIEDFQNFINPKGSKRVTDPLDVINKAIEIFKSDPKVNDIDFLKDTMDTPEFQTYQNELTTILVNILVNAKEAIISNNVKFGVIKLKEYVVDDNIHFEVSDNGGGIPANILPKIFDPYFSTKNEKHGVGLGLYMCKTIIDMHLGGSVEVTNHNTGATFKITLPMR